MINKKCYKCGTELNEENYYLPLEKYHQYICKQCSKKRVKQWQIKNPEKFKKKNKEWRMNRPEYQKQWRKNNPERHWAHGALGQHRRTGFVVDINIEDLIILAKETKNCPICGVKLDWTANKRQHQPNSPSLDRINNGNILNKDNIWIICYECNAIKRNKPLKDFIEYCRLVVEKEKELMIKKEITNEL